MSASHATAGSATSAFQWEVAKDNTDRTIDWLLGAPLQIIAIIVGAFIIRWLAHRVIARVVTRAASFEPPGARPNRRGSKVLAGAAGALVSERRKQRAETVGSVLRSVTSIVIFGIAFLTVLEKMGIPIAPLLASAGVLGVALGFGAQSLVRDFLSGIFMILEDQYGVGDVIDTGGTVGTVEEMSLRITRLRDGSGVVWYVRNGEILRVGNHSQGWSVAIVDIDVDYAEDVSRVQGVIRDVVDELAQDPAWAEKLIDDPVVAGVESVTPSAVTLRVVIKCTPNDSSGVQRELRERIKVAFDREKIRMPGAVVPPGPEGPG